MIVEIISPIHELQEKIYQKSEIFQPVSDYIWNTYNKSHKGR